MDQLSGRRNRSLDAAKGIGILLVVFAHVNFIEPWQTIIYGFHMPLFYVIAGMLFRRERYPKFSDFFKRRFRTLILPYLLFALLSLLYSAFLVLITDGFTKEETSKLLSHFVQIFISQYSKKMTSTSVPLWFVPNLFLIECLYYFISSIKSKPLHWLTILVLVAFGWYTESAYCPLDFSVLPWNFSSALFSLGFYAVGFHFKDMIIDPMPSVLRKTPALRRFLIFVLCFALEVPLSLYNGHVSVGSRVLSNGFVFYATGILGAVGTISLASFFQKSRFITFCGRASFYIMATHKLFVSMLFVAIKALFSVSMEDSGNNWLESLFVFAVTTTLSVLFSYYYIKIKERIQKKREDRAAAV